MKILLTGASGQLGRSIKIQKPKDLELITFDRVQGNTRFSLYHHK